MTSLATREVGEGEDEDEDEDWSCRLAVVAGIIWDECDEPESESVAWAKASEDESLAVDGGC